MVAGSFCSGQLVFSKIEVFFKCWLVAGGCFYGNLSYYMNALKNGWYLVAFALSKWFFFINNSLKNSMVVGSFCSGTALEIYILFKNWTVAGSFFSGYALFLPKLMCSLKTCWYLVAVFVAIDLSKRMF